MAVLPQACGLLSGIEHDTVSGWPQVAQLDDGTPWSDCRILALVWCKNSVVASSCKPGAPLGSKYKERFCVHQMVILYRSIRRGTSIQGNEVQCC